MRQVEQCSTVPPLAFVQLWYKREGMSRSAMTMFIGDRFTHFCYAQTEPDTGALVTPLLGVEVMVSSFNIHRFRVQSGFAGWLILENMSVDILVQLLSSYAVVVKGLLFKIRFSELVSGGSSHFIADFFLEKMAVYRRLGYQVGILCDVDLDILNLTVDRWLYYQGKLDVFVVNVNRCARPYSLLVLYVIGTLIRLGVCSNKLVVPFCLPDPAVLDVYNLRGWLVNEKNVLEDNCWVYLPAYGMRY